MDTYEARLAAWEAELRDKYTQAERDEMAKSGEALPDGSYPIKDRKDVENAIETVGLGNAADSTIRKHIIKRAKALGASDLIPDEWNADGSKSEKKNAALAKAERRRKERRRAVPLVPEVRFFEVEGLEIREADKAGNLVSLVGYPIIYNTPYEVVDPWGSFQERMLPGVAADVLSGDTRFMYNHRSMTLARTLSGTMTMEDSTTRLCVKPTVDIRHSLANDLVIAIERGDIGKMSVGFLCGEDRWNEEMDDRTVVRFKAMPDVSAVDFPASPSTSIQIARRMMMEMPVESRSRVRKLYIDLRAADLRAGKVLSGANQDQIAQATKLLHGVLAGSGLDPATLLDGDDDTATDATSPDVADASGFEEDDSGDATSAGDDSGLRQDDPGEKIRAERRAAEASYNDQFSAASDALMGKYGDDDGDCDLWVCDMSDDWIVFESYVDPPGQGTWQIDYTLDGDTIILGDEPKRVARQTSYVPVATDTPAGTVTPTKTSRALHIRAEARKLRVL